MKGPGIRLDNDIRRVWQCPKCQQQMKTGGNVTSNRCRCEPNGVVMALVEPRRQVRTFPAPPLEPPEPEPDDDISEVADERESPAATPIEEPETASAEKAADEPVASAEQSTPDPADASPGDADLTDFGDGIDV